jgi:hypothetical protein
MAEEGGSTRFLVKSLESRDSTVRYFIFSYFLISWFSDMMPLCFPNPISKVMSSC